MGKHNSKQVKVQRKYRPSQSHRMGALGKEVPWLNLSGVWLKQVGFRIGDLVEITVKENELTIKPIS